LRELEAETNAEISTTVLTALQQGVDGEVVMRRVEFVGPQVGEELTEQGILAVVYALIGIFLYVMIRFQWRFSVGAVAALVHDIIITMGILSAVGIEFDLTVVAALLAVIGYSLNDTIVLFDRIRENFPKLRKATSMEVVNTSVNETLSRTLMTSLTTLLVLVALFVFGGEIINAFAFTLIAGVLVGTYSSIYVASTTLLELGVSKFDLLAVEKEGAGAVLDEMP
jgi:preprotein translocase subunit SecF